MYDGSNAFYSLCIVRENKTGQVRVKFARTGFRIINIKWSFNIIIVYLRINLTYTYNITNMYSHKFQFVQYIVLRDLLFITF